MLPPQRAVWVGASIGTLIALSAILIRLFWSPEIRTLPVFASGEGQHPIASNTTSGTTPNV